MNRELETVSTGLQNYADKISSHKCFDRATLESFNTLIDEILIFIRDKDVSRNDKDALILYLNNKSIEVNKAVECKDPKVGFDFSYLQLDMTRTLKLFIGKFNAAFDLAEAAKNKN